MEGTDEPTPWKLPTEKPEPWDLPTEELPVADQEVVRAALTETIQPNISGVPAEHPDSFRKWARRRLGFISISTVGVAYNPSGKND